MGGSAQHVLDSLNIFHENKKSMRSPRVNSAAGVKRTHVRISKRPRRVLMKRIRRFSGLEGSRRPRNGVDRKVRTLKKLVPSCSDAIGLDGLLRETAGYILALGMRVRVMQIMVKVLSTGSDDNNKYSIPS